MKSTQTRRSWTGDKVEFSYQRPFHISKVPTIIKGSIMKESRNRERVYVDGDTLSGWFDKEEVMNGIISMTAAVTLL